VVPRKSEHKLEGSKLEGSIAVFDCVAWPAYAEGA
jgi:hypothetical protein